MGGKMISHSKTPIFELTKKNPDFNNIRFCSLALNKDNSDPRFHINYLKIKIRSDILKLKIKSRLTCIGTDGCRLHYCDSLTNDYPQGYYKVFRNSPSKVTMVKAFDINDENCKYPEFYSLVDIGHRKIDIKNLYISKSTYLYAYTDIIKTMDKTTGEIFNIDFLKGLDDTFDVYIPIFYGNPIILKSINRTALIMPMNKMRKKN